MAGAGAVGPLLFLCALAFGYGVLRLFLRRVPVRAIGRSRVFRQPETVAVFLAMAVGSLMAVDAFGLALAAMVLVFAAGFLGLIGGCELALLAWSRGAGFGQAVKEVRLRYRPAGEARWNTAVRVGDGGAWG